MSEITTHTLHWVQGNTVNFAIPLQKETKTQEGKIVEDYYPDAQDIVSVFACGKYLSTQLECVVNGNVVIAKDNGNLKNGIYGIEITIAKSDGTKLRSMWNYQVEIHKTNDGVLTEWNDFLAQDSQTLDAAVFFFAKGDKGDDGDDGKSAYQSYLDTTTDNPPKSEEEWSAFVDSYTKTEVDNIVAPFITKSVNDLVNYYLKSETYTKTEVQALIAAIRQFTYSVVSELPTASVETMHTIYLVPSADPQAQNVKDEYITIDNGAEAATRYTWEKIGSTAIDLSGYYTSAQTDAAITTALNTALAAYTTTTDLTTLLAGKQDKIDSTHKLSADLIEDGSTNKAYTADEKTKLNGIEQGAQVNVKPDWNAQSGSTAEILNKPTIPTVPTNVSAFTNDAGYITKTVNDLVNYYLKADVYTKTEVANLIAAIQQFHYEIAASTSAVTTPASNVLYLIGPTGSGSDKYEEYVYDSTKQEPWVKIGDTSIDLSGYYTSQQTDAAITTALNTALADYTTTANLTKLLSGKENASNKVTSISAQSTDAQYPSAKCVYDVIGNIETLLAAI